MLTTTKQYVEWQENTGFYKARWLSQSNYPPPTRIAIADDTTTANEAYRLASAGTSMLWRGDFHNAKQLLQALNRRIDRAEARKNNKQSQKHKDSKTPRELIKTTPHSPDVTHLFHQKRLAQSQRTRLLSRLLLQLEPGYKCSLRRAPNVSDACTAAFGELNEPSLLSFRDLQGAIGADQWRKKGINIEGLDFLIYPHYGVFAPTRHEYVQLLLDAPLPDKFEVAYDIGTGTGLLAILLAKRGAKQVIASDINPRALACASDNILRLGISNIQLQQTDLFPTGAVPANLIVCNPPWLPSKPTSPLEYAVYDAKSAMLRGFLKGVKQHLAEQGEVWLILSDLAEHLQLRTRDELLGWFSDAGLTVNYRLDTTPKHTRSQDMTDPLYEARSKEITSLWCLH